MNYTIKQFPNKSFTDKMDMVIFMEKNLEELMAIKKSEYKTKSEVHLKSEIVEKEFNPTIEKITSDFIEVKAIINTTNVIDSHMDLHDYSIWNKTVKDNKYSYHLKQHEAIFESVLSNKALNTNEQMNFKDLGLNIDFKTTANLNTFVLSKKSQDLMFNKYANGEVKEHSVGMIYVDLELAYYDERNQKNMDFFEKVKSMAINPEVADEFGYVWLVKEAKKREGSAVVFGSNSITPTLYVKNYEPSNGTHSTIKTEPKQFTQDYSKVKFI